MQNTDETKKRMINLLQTKGPCLPVQISREIKMSTLFISAFLSELKDEKRIKISNLKVGGSPLYYLEGQETQLENFKQYLHQKEVEALDSLKRNKILKDSDQEPVMRVALRSIKDFAFSFTKDNQLYWRFLTVTEQDVKDILEPQKKVEEIKIEPIKIIEQKEANIKSSETNLESSDLPKSEPATKKPKTPRKPKEPSSSSQITIQQFHNPLALLPEPPKPEKIKPKSKFVENTIEFLEKNKFKIIEEKEYKAKEYNCICQLKTDLGPIDFLTQAKDKKSVSDSDLDALLRQAQSIPLPALFLYTGNLSKKAVEYEQKYYSVLKTKKIAP